MKKKITIIILIAVVLATAIYLFVKGKKNTIAKEIEQNGNGINTNVSSVINLASPYLKTNAKFPLMSGSKGMQVAHVQKWLNNGVINPPYALQYPQLVVDGILGVNTVKALANVGLSSISQSYYNSNIPIIFKS